LIQKYRVIITPAAEEDVAESFAYIHARSPLNGARWLKSLYYAVFGQSEQFFRRH
jgi:plasmid stabilization system protein ParE